MATNAMGGLGGGGGSGGGRGEGGGGYAQNSLLCEVDLRWKAK